jgi:serine/threonine-protein kinase RsbW
MTPCDRASHGSDRLPTFDIELRCDPSAVRAALRQVLDRLDPLDLGVNERGTIELVLAEALNNIVEHAYARHPQSGKIAIRCLHRGDGLHVRILDWGRAMPGGQAPIGPAPDAAAEVMDLPEGGFGWFLIRDLAKDVRYTRAGDQNQLDLRLPIAI